MTCIILFQEAINFIANFNQIKKTERSTWERVQSEFVGLKLSLATTGNHQVLIHCSQSDRWLRQANIIDGWNTTTIHTAIAFRKTSKGKIFLDFRSWQHFLSELSAARKLDLTDLISKLEMCGKPALNLSKKR